MYQIVHAEAYTAEATEDFGAIEVGLICLRNLTRSCGRWTGRWCYGDKIWGSYKDLATKVSYKTKKIMQSRGIGPDPGAFSLFEDDIKTGVYVEANDESASFYFQDIKPLKDEPDNLSLDFVLTQGRSIIRVQPSARDLHWIQIEDFVEIFNRSYIINDPMNNPKLNYVSKVYISQWIPGDYIGLYLFLFNLYNKTSVNIQNSIYFISG